MLAEGEHRDVAVGIAGSDQRSTPGSTPDANRLLRAVVQVVGGRRVRDRAAAVVVRVGKCGCAADDPFARNAIDLLAYPPHEVAVAPGDDVFGEVILSVVTKSHHNG